MNDFLRKIKLIDSFDIELPMSKNEFITKLKNQVEPGNTGVFSGVFEVFFSSKKDYIGEVNHSDFKIRRRRRFFEMNKTKAVASGNIKEEFDSIKIATEITGYSNVLLIFLGFILIFYLFFIPVVIVNDDIPLFILIFILLHGLLMVGIPYFMIRKGVENMKRGIERDFFYFTK